MNPDAVKASYVRALASKFGPGETIVFRRGTTTTYTDYSVHAWITGFVTDELVANVSQGKRRCIMLAADVAAAGITLPFKPKQDRVVWGSKTNVITAVNDGSRRIQGEIIAYEMELGGP